MTTQTLTITDFLLARITEDAVAALGFGRQQWRPGLVAHDGVAYPSRPSVGRVEWWGPVEPTGMVAGDVWVQSSNHDQRGLAECRAKRRIVKEHEPFFSEQMGFERCFCCGADNLTWPCRTIAALAAIYADHSDYRKEWRA